MEKERKYNKKLNICLVLGVIAIVVVAITTCFSFEHIIIKCNNEYSIIKVSELNNYVNSYFNKNITLMDKKLTYSELGILSQFNDIDLGNKLILNVDNIDVAYNTDNLKNKLSELNKNRVHSKEAYIIKGTDKFELKSVEIGNYIDIDKLSECIATNLGNNIKVGDISKYYEDDTILKEQESNLQKEVGSINNFKIAYDNGFELGINDIIDYIDIDSSQGSSIKIDITDKEKLFSSLDEKIEKELAEYDTVGNERDFITTSGKAIKVKGGTWGNIFSSDDETEYIINKIKDNDWTSEENRKPIYSREMNSDIGNSYIEISLDEQHLWRYVNGKLESDTDVVTGKAGKHDTPRGVYFVSEKINGKYLRGTGYVTWVNKWMRLTNSGIGLHDAYWRSSFGDEIYKTNGSHGCINLPKAYAYELFKKIQTGDCVVIY